MRRATTIPLLSIILLGGALLARHARTEEEAPVSQTARIDALSWLSGTWRGKVGEDVVEEIWGEPLGHGMAGVFRWLRGEDIYMYEILAIEPAGEDGLVMRLRHFGAGLKPWESGKEEAPSWALLTLKGHTAVFEDPVREFPRRLVYEHREEEDTLVVRLEGTRDGKPSTMQFLFRRP